MGNVCLVSLMLSSYPIRRMVARCCKGHKMLLPFASYASANHSQLVAGAHGVRPEEIVRDVADFDFWIGLDIR